MRTLTTVELALVNVEAALGSTLRAASLIEQGQVDMVRLRPTKDGRYNITDGRRRIADLLSAGAKTVQAVVEDVDETTVHLHALILNTGSPNKMDEAKHIAELQQAGWTLEDLSRATGMSAGTLSNRVKLLSLVPELQQRVNTGEVVYSAAYELSKCPRTVQRAVACKTEKVTYAIARQARRDWEAETLQTGQIQIPAFLDAVEAAAETGPSLLLSFAQMRQLIDTGELFVDWNDKALTIEVRQ